jgi:hypothetical protein
MNNVTYASTGHSLLCWPISSSFAQELVRNGIMEISRSGKSSSASASKFSIIEVQVYLKCKFSNRSVRKYQADSGSSQLPAHS